MTAEVIAPGPQTTLQGGPRLGYRHRGVPWAGAADPVSLSIANRLVGNPVDALAIETTFGGLRLAFEASADIGLAGAVADAELDGEPTCFHETIHIRAGQTLNIGAPATGLRSYVAIAGGWHARRFLGSSSTYIPASFGGLEGRALRKGDLLSWNAGQRAPDTFATPNTLRPLMQNSWALRVTVSAEFDWLDKASQKRLFSVPFLIDRDSNRMGVRLNASPLEFAVERQLASGPVFPGMLQCPPSGEAIILLADGQTTGGYPRVCQIIRADRHLIGQLRPGDRLQLLYRTEEAALAALRRKGRLLGEWLKCDPLY